MPRSPSTAGIPSNRALAARMSRAARHLAATHPTFERLITQVGPCRLRPMPDPFSMLVSTVVSQQISVKAAESITARIVALTKKNPLTPRAILAADDVALRACGLTAAKFRTIRELAARVADGRLDLRRLGELDDDGVAEALLPIPGIGPWSVQMVLIFGLCRLDILPIGDLGFRYGVRDLFEMKTVPTAEKLEALAEAWRPYRTIATWYVWRSRRMKLPTDRSEPAA
jgi:DNA-3-methyladenine glycosylase II